MAAASCRLHPADCKSPTNDDRVTDGERSFRSLVLAEIKPVRHERFGIAIRLDEGAYDDPQRNGTSVSPLSTGGT